MKVPTIIMIEMILRNRDSVKIVSKLMLGDESWAGDPQPYPPPLPLPRQQDPAPLPFQIQSLLFFFSSSGTAHGFTLSCSRYLLTSCYSKQVVRRQQWTGPLFNERKGRKTVTL